MAKRRTPRTRGTSPHPGVVIEKPDAVSGTGWRMRWKDPIAGKVRKVTLDVERYPTDASRTEAARRKSVEIHAMRLDKREGVISMPVRDALKRYLAERRRLLRGRTLRDYERIGDIFATWCEGQGVTFAREITRAKLEAFRTERLTLPSERDPDQLRAPNTLNIELRAVHTMLRTWRRFDWLSIDRDAISDSLRQETVHADEIEFLRPAQCKALLRAVIAHDGTTYALTRKEHKGKGRPGTTRKWPPLAPFVACVVCTGMRLGEALNLTWRDVSLVENVIVLRATATKTKRARRFDLEYAPLLKFMLDKLHLAHVNRGAKQDERVFHELTLDTVEAARKRIAKTDKPQADPSGFNVFAGLKLNAIGSWSWQTLRRTAATALCNMANVGPWQESKLLGHSVTVAERLYAGRMKISPDVKTIERALGIEKELATLLK